MKGKLNSIKKKKNINYQVYAKIIRSKELNKHTYKKNELLCI